jgi:predicted permease
VDVWTALHLNSLDPGYDGVNFKMIGRLRDNMSAAQAQQQMDTLRDAFYKQYPEYRRGAHPGRLRSFRVWPLQQIIVSEARTSLLTMLAAVIAVLLVACLNLGVLMTARASRRAPEIALRTALGATRRSILGLLMGESLLLALGGGAGGLVLARVMAPMLLRFSPIAIPQLGTRAGMQLVFVPVVTCAATMLFGLIPALGVFRQDVNQAIKPGAVGESPLQARLGKVLLVGQIAISMVLLSTALLLLGSFLRLRSVPSGIAVKQLTIAQVLLQGSEYDSTLHTTQFIDKVMAGLDHYHGVERVAAINGLPLDRGLNENGYPTAKPEVAQPIEIRAVTPGYFRTLGIAALSGRDITEADNATAVRVALVSNATARRWWPGEIPIGEQITMGGADEAPRTIIGTVSDVPQRSLAEAPQVVVYVPFAQLSDVDMKAMNTWFPTTFCVRMAGNVEIAEAIRRAVSDSDRDISVTAIEPMQNVIDRTIAGPAFFSYLAISFAGFAMLLTIVGLFGLLSYQVTQRTREIGIRLALGAPRIEVFSRVSGSALLLATIGLGLGGLISMAVPHVVGNILSHYVYTSGRPIAEVLLNTTAVLAMAAVTVLITTLCASYLPARRAAKIQPIGALRVE